MSLFILEFHVVFFRQAPLIVPLFKKSEWDDTDYCHLHKIIVIDPLWLPLPMPQAPPYISVRSLRVEVPESDLSNHLSMY